MIIHSVEVEPEGWTLAVTHDAPATSATFPFSSGSTGYNPQHPDFALSPDDEPKVVLTVQSAPEAGWTRSGGQAVPGAHNRQIVATMPLRRAFPNNVQLWEDEVSGRRRVRLALSDRIYQGETVTAATFLPGWRTGTTVAETPAVSNVSTRTAPVPHYRWVTVPMQIASPTRPPLRVEMLVASHHPQAFGSRRHLPVAAVKFQAFDGTNAGPEVWVTEPTVSPLYADNGPLECYGVDVLASGLCTGLRSGPVSVHATVYPWIGSQRSTGSGHVWNGNTPFLISPDKPLYINWDQDGTRYPVRYVAVDPDTGSTTASAVTVSSDWEAAKNGTRAANLRTAFLALYHTPPTVPGGPGIYINCDGGEARIMPGKRVGYGSTADTSAVNNLEGWCTITHDPDAPDPLACVVHTDLTFGIASRVHFKGIRVERTSAAFFGGTGRSIWFDGGESAGINGTVINASGAPTTSDVCRHFATGHVFRGQSLGAYQLGNLFGLARGCTGAVNGQAIVSHDGSRLGTPYTLWGATSDHMLWNVRCLRASDSTSGGLFNRAGSTRAPFVSNIWQRLTAVNVLWEIRNISSGSEANPLEALGEGQVTSTQDAIMEGVQTVGARFNWHNDPASGTPTLFHTGNVMRNCWWERQGTKHDDFASEPKPDAVGSWEQLYGVGWEGNVNNNRISTSPANFQYMYFGLGARVQTAFSTADRNPWPGYVLEASPRSPAPRSDDPNHAVDYRPAEGSPAQGRGRTAVTRYDIDGQERGSTFAAGAYRGKLRLSPDAARMLHYALPGQLTLHGLRPRLGPAGTRHAVSSTPSALHVRGRPWIVTPDLARLGVEGSAALLEARAAPVDPRLRTLTLLPRGALGRARPR